MRDVVDEGSKNASITVPCNALEYDHMLWI